MKIDNGSLSSFTLNGYTQITGKKLQSNDEEKFSAVLDSNHAKKTEGHLTADTAVPAANVTDDFRASLVASAKQSNSKAESLLDQFTQVGYDQLLDVSSWPTIRYTVSGELQTPESVSYFNSMRAGAMQDRTELLATERAKGTLTADILDKVLAFNSELPQRFKNMANITY